MPAADTFLGSCGSASKVISPLIGVISKYKYSYLIYIPNWGYKSPNWGYK